MEVGEFCGFLCGTEQESTAALGNKIHTTNDRKGRFLQCWGIYIYNTRERKEFAYKLLQKARHRGII